MTSTLTDIYNAIESWPITLDGKVVAVRGLDELQNQVTAADMPIRLLVPYGRWWDVGGEDMTFIAFRDMSRLTWTIRDMMLYKPVRQGLGLADVAGPLARYAAAYVDTVTDNRQLTNTAWVGQALVLPGVYEWPLESGNFYWGVEATIRAEEIVSTT